MTAALIVMGVTELVGLGLDIYGDIEKSKAAQTQADQQTQADNLKLQQEQQNIAQLTTNQASDLASYKSQQALEETNQSTAEQNAYVSANDQLRSSQEQLGSNIAGVESQASGIIAGAASRGIKVGSGAVQSAAATGKGDITTNPDGSVSYSKPGANIYDSSSSPLAQLAAYETSANRSIANEAEGVVGASNLATGEIQSGTAAFEAQQGQNLGTFQQNQAQVLAGANLGYDQSVAAFNQQEDFTKTDLQTYDSSLWLAAFSSVASTGASLVGSLWTPKAYVAPQVTVASYQSSDYTDWNQYAQYGQYRG